MKPTSSHWGRRKRRLRLTLTVLLVVALVGGLGGWLVYRAAQPDVRRPGEELPEITEKLSRGLPEDAPSPTFTDVTAEAGLASFRTFVGPRTSQLPEDMGAGVAWGDYDNDGDDDLFLVSAGGALDLPREEWAPSELYENLGNGTFRRVEDFPELRISGMGAAWGDADGDGWLDLAITGYRSLLLLRNQEGRLAPWDALPELDGYWSGVTWADFDNDRDPDLYVSGYVRYEEDTGTARQVTEQYGTAVPYTLNPASFEPQRNLLFENDGAGGFTEVAELLGVSNPAGRSLTALWHDFDADGRLDLYVANDISDNALLLNRGETFEDAGLTAWVADYRGAMGLAAGDWNRDGDDDLFVTHWIAQENALYDSRLVDFRRQREGSGQPSQGDLPPVQLSFSDLAAPLGLGQIALHSVGWGTEFADFDGDGWLDLVVANGSTIEDDQSPKGLKTQPAMLLWNRRGEYFHDLAPLSDELATPRVGRGLGLSDFDADGDLDILLVDLADGVRLLRNDMQRGNWIELRLRSRTDSAGEPRGFAEGATVIARVDGVELRRTVGGGSYLSQSSRTLHFGLGEAAGVDGLEVHWLGGEVQTFPALEGGTRWELVEGEPEPRRLVTAGALDERERIVEFWAAHHAAMDAIKKEGDCERAVPLFRRALELDPSHEDARYYLANCLAVMGHPEKALAELDRLRVANPLSHRGHKQWGVLRALHATSQADLEAAEAALERSLDINREETGSLLALGEIAMLRGDAETAEQRLEWACRTNPRAVGGFFLRAYLAWESGDEQTATQLLARAREARGEEWKPEGAVAEGDVARRMHREESPLSRFWQSWDGSLDPAAAFAPLDAHLRDG